MGIVSWIERTQGTDELSCEIWRDVNGAQQNIEPKTTDFYIENSVKEISSEIMITPEHQKNKNSEHYFSIVEVDELKKISSVQLTADLMFKHDVQLEVYCTADFALIVDMRTVNEIQKILWKNIQHSIKKYDETAELFYCNWSYSWLDDMINRNLADYYLKGYLDYYIADKIIFVLGDLPFYQEVFKQHYQYRTFATLAELQDMPQNKRILWQAIQDVLKSKYNH